MPLDPRLEDSVRSGVSEPVGAFYRGIAPAIFVALLLIYLVWDYKISLGRRSARDSWPFLSTLE